MKHSKITLYKAAAICDAQGTFARPGAVAVKNGRVIDAGHPENIAKRHHDGAKTIDLSDSLLIPALVNAHAHLDLSSIAPGDYCGDFIQWLKNVIAQRPTSEKEISAAVEKGLEMSRSAGVGYLADIAGSVQAIVARRNASDKIALAGVSYLETLGIGHNQPQSIEKMTRTLEDLPFETQVQGYDRGVILGIEPHAPYSTGHDIYKQAIQLSRRAIYRLSTHLAESKQELEFINSATGPFADLLKEIGKWDDSIQPTGKHPVDLLENELKKGRWLVAHCNYVDETHIDTLQRTGTSVVYCPVASDYFGHTNHKYIQMLGAAVNVCLGTDSLACQSKNAVQPLGIFTQMRYLYRRDQTDPLTLLRMATTNGMLALELSENDATLNKRATAHFAAIKINPDDPRDPLQQALTNSNPVRPI